jgi:hypothetical protein
MKVVILILAFVCILFSGFLFYSGSSIESLQQYKDFYWVPIDISIVLFVISFLLQKDPKKG